MFNFDWNLQTWIALLVLIAFAELASVIIFGYFFCTVVEFKHRNPSTLLRLFQYGEYTPQHDLNIGGWIPTPKRYRFVVIEYQADNRIISETYYTLLGDIIQVRYTNGETAEWAGSKGNYLSNRVLLATPIFGFGVLSLSTYLIGILGDYNELIQQISGFGSVLFCSIFISYPIKSMLLDPLSR